MRMKKFKRFVSLLTGAAVCASLSVAVPVSAATATGYVAPSHGVTANDKILGGSAYAASTVSLSVLGINITSSNGAGIWNAGGDNQAGAANLGIFGSDINDNPDPYLYNFYYNSSKYGGGEDYNTQDYSSWTATPYSIRCDGAKVGPAGLDTNTTLIVSVGGTTKTFNAAFFYEPDILIASSMDGYADYIKQYNDTYNTNYDPTIVTHTCPMNAHSDGLGLEYNQFDMAAGLIEIAKAVQDTMEETGKTTRYAEGPYEIAVNYDKYGRGLYYYAQSKFASGALTKINYASSVTYDASTDSWAVVDSTTRQAQYASGIGNNIYDLLKAGYKFSDGSTVSPTTITTTTRGPGAGGATSQVETQGFYLTTSQLIEILNAPTASNAKATGVIIGAVGIGDGYAELLDAGVRFLSDLPECVYGMTMQTVENGMGIPFYLSYFYYDQDNSFDPASMIAYWMEHFYHISDTTAMRTVVNNMLTDSDLPAHYTINMNKYNASEIENMIISGIKYYRTIESSLSSLEKWSCLDCSVGIGSSDASLKSIGADIEPELSGVFTNSGGVDKVPAVSCEASADVDPGNGTGEPTTPTEPSTPATPSKFSDVAAGSWYEEAVDYAVSNGLFTGTSDTTFSPNSGMTRAMLVTVLHRAENEPSAAAAAFSDVPSGKWYTNAVGWASANQIVSGISERQFAPDNNITREQLVTILYRYAQQKGYSLDSSAPATGAVTAMKDWSSVKSYAQDAMEWAYNNGIISGMGDGTIAPAGNATRAQVATIIMNFNKRFAA